MQPLENQPRAWRLFPPERRLAALAWSAVLGSFLLLLWISPHVPTQDGPAHLANAVTLRDCLRGDPRANQVCTITWQPLPNWSCFALLAGLSCAFPPLIAEKILVSLYLLGFAGGFRYFVAALSSEPDLPSLAGFLLVFNRCFWMGFYNYCLCLPLFFCILGYLLRTRTRFGAREGVVLGLLLTLAFLTHVFGYLLAVAGSLWIAATVPPRGWRKAACLLAAFVPTLLLTGYFFHEARYAGAGGSAQLWGHLRGWVAGTDQWERLSGDVAGLEMQTFGIRAGGTVTLGMGAAVLFELFVLGGLLNGAEVSGEARVRRRSILLLGVLLAALYLLAPDILVPGKGGFWKARLVLLPPLLWFACIHVPSAPALRYGLLGATLLLFGWQLGVVGSFLRASNQELREFTAGQETVGRGRVLACRIRGGQQGSVNPMTHAGAYYCLNSGNIDLSPHFRTRLHSVVRLRPGLEEWQGDFGMDPPPLVDTLLIWEARPLAYVPAGFELVFQQGRLKVLRWAGGRPNDPDNEPENEPLLP